MVPPVVTGPLAVVATLIVAVTEAGDGSLVGALTGFLVALTILIHTVVAERTRRQANEVKRKVRPQVRRNTKDVTDLQEELTYIRGVAEERGEAIRRMDRRINVLMKASPAPDPHPEGETG